MGTLISSFFEFTREALTHILNGKEKRIDFNDITHCLTRGPPSHTLECAGILGALILISPLSALLFYPLAPEMVLQGFHPGFLHSSYLLLTPSLQERIGNNNFTTLKHKVMLNYSESPLIVN